MSQYYYNPFGSSDVNEARQREFNKQQLAKTEKHEIRIISFSMGCAIIAYLFIQSVVLEILSAFGFYDLYMNNSVFHDAITVFGVSLASVAVPFGIMALVNKKRYSCPVIPDSRLKASRAFVWICFGMCCCCLLQIVMSYIIVFFQTVFGLELRGSESLEQDSVFACFINLIATAIIPAICEEFAMRCCSLQLIKKYGKGFGVVAVSIVFGLLHGNVAQFLFAFFIGLVLGLITVKTDSIVPAIFIHALNNGMSVIQSTVNYAAGEKIAPYVTLAIYLFWICAGILAFIYLVLKKELFKTEKSTQSVLTTGQKFTAFLFPWMIIPFLVLIVITVLTIKKV
ncbi:MAG: lysostaphin resistance A-like protein [Eubacterium sp.]